MKKGGGGNKGRNYERILCRQLSLWWTNNARDDVFWRTSGSGACATVRAKKGKQTKHQYSDIAAIDEEGKLLLEIVTIELKRGYNNVTINDLFDSNKGLLREWIKHAGRDAKHAGSEGWMIIHKRDRREAIVYASDSIMYRLSFGGKRGCLWLYHDKLGKIWCRSFGDFLNHFSNLH